MFLHEYYKQIAVQMEGVTILLADESRWTKGAMARDKNNIPVEPWDKSATKFCLLGACAHVTGMKYSNPLIPVIGDMVRKTTSFHFTASFNDAEDTSHADILLILNSALQKAKQDFETYQQNNPGVAS